MACNVGRTYYSLKDFLSKDIFSMQKHQLKQKKKTLVNEPESASCSLEIKFRHISNHLPTVNHLKNLSLRSNVQTEPYDSIAS